MSRLLEYALAALFSWASTVEWQHARRGLDRGDILRTVGPAIAAISLGFIASECLDGQWL